MQRRHRRHLTEWQSLIDEFAAGDLSVDQFCLRHDLAPANFRRWHMRLTGDASSASRPTKTTRFVPVVPPDAEHASAPPVVTTSTMRLHHGGVQLELPADTPATRVVELIKAISHA